MSITELNINDVSQVQGGVFIERLVVFGLGVFSGYMLHNSPPSVGSPLVKQALEILEIIALPVVVIAALIPTTAHLTGRLNMYITRR